MNKWIVTVRIDKKNELIYNCVFLFSHTGDEQTSIIYESQTFRCSNSQTNLCCSDLIFTLLFTFHAGNRNNSKLCSRPLCFVWILEQPHTRDYQYQGHFQFLKICYWVVRVSAVGFRVRADSLFLYLKNFCHQHLISQRY